MNTKSALFAIALSPMVVTGANASMYQNNVGAINLNMLTERLMAYAHMDENISDLIDFKEMYGTMKRIDEYGDDGTIVRKKTITKDDDDLNIARSVWADVQYLNSKADYNDNVSERSRIRMETIGFNTRDFDLSYGSLSFGAFLGNIAEDIFSFTGNGFMVGGFARYNYYNMVNVTALIDNGSINRNSDTNEFNNAWINYGLDVSTNIRLTNVIFLRPKMYAGYTTVSAYRTRINDGILPYKKFRFLNLVPSVDLSARLARNLYSSLSAKYVSVNGDTDKNVYLNDAIVDKTTAKDYAEFGLDLEYDYEPVVIKGYIHKQTNGFDGWVGNIGVKYMF